MSELAYLKRKFYICWDLLHSTNPKHKIVKNKSVQRLKDYNNFNWENVIAIHRKHVNKYYSNH